MEANVSSGQGEWLHRRFESAVSGSLVAREFGRSSEVSFSWLQAPEHFFLHDVTPEDAYTVHVNRVPHAILNIEHGGRPGKQYHMGAGAVSIYDLADLPMMSMDSRFDVVRIHMPRAGLQMTASDLGLRGQLLFDPRPPGFDDRIITSLATMLDCCFAAQGNASQLFLDHLGMLVQVHLLEHYLAPSGRRKPPPGRLSAWQIARAKELIEAHLEQDISMPDLAMACNLSPGYFARAFRHTTGLSPYQWLLERRAERAKKLLLGTKLPLAEIASACGFCDQSHMGRIFGRRFGASPASWRRHHTGLRCRDICQR